MKQTRQGLLAAAVVIATAASLTACSGPAATTSGGATEGGDAATEVHMVLWNNEAGEAQKSWWVESAKLFGEAHPGVTIDVQTVQNEDYDGKLQNAMNAGDSPDIFLTRGGGKMYDQVKAGQVMDMNPYITDELRTLIKPGYFEAMSYDGGLYAMPLSVVPTGIFYSKDLFAQAGITSEPTTLAELNEAVVKLKAAGITPIAVGGKDAWPAAYWYYMFVYRECPIATLQESFKTYSFEDACFIKAGEDLIEFRDTKPFQEGFLTTSAQQGAGSSAGLLANHKAAMEFMGAWEPAILQGLTADGQPMADLGAFPLPSVEGAGGSQTAQMGGASGYSCYVDAPKECVDFLAFIASDRDRQVTQYEAFGWPPVVQEVQEEIVTEEYMLHLIDGLNKADALYLMLDSIYGQNVGNALNQGAVEILAGSGTPQSMIELLKAAAAKE
ncbi:MAG: extracellular solute-binding protein [Propionibacteriaceae bacterium]|jgi:ABC-type glycerol-3-phosphate transport system substrate-binding protein|nr:extracellular solute-binding protein [Propionibacteriaceae bacterium]